jgi:hypothetical protein
MHSSLNGGSDVYTNIATGSAQTGCWTQLKGTYTLASTADSITMYVEGPDAGVEVYVIIAAVVLTSGGGGVGSPNNLVSASGGVGLRCQICRTTSRFAFVHTGFTNTKKELA